MRRFKFGWFGDNNLGENLIGLILARRKTATSCPAYDPQDADVVVGEKLLLVDKHDNARGVLRVTRIEARLFKDFDEALAAAEGTTLEELLKATAFANGREMRPEEEMRITWFELLSDKPPSSKK